MSPGNSVVFDYGIPPSTLGIRERMAYRGLARRVARSGESFRSFFLAEELASELQRLGFQGIEDLDAAEIDSRYFANRRDNLGVRSKAAHLVCATS